MPRKKNKNARLVDLSIVVPAFNEAENIEPLIARLWATLEGEGLSWEVLFVDDGSEDKTLLMLEAAHQRDSRIKTVALSRNFGKEVALSAGLKFAQGAAVIPMDADLQHPPELITLLVAEWRKGAEVVTAVRRSRKTDPVLRRLSSRLFYRMFNLLSDVPVIDGGGDFRLLDRSVVDTLNQLPERARFMKGLYGWVGYRQVQVPYVV